ncbi:YoaK family protein [Brevundimonas naejangsanensis]|uniref:YoaK family protein n=1 Tax=Brevundimonas naejangsanensis TaxID=588932 RepID=UPI0026ED5DCE|nr:YoaK family protein [Brevundimonas naejangsanensis]
MRTLTAPDRWLALLLAALAGYVDSLGFLHLGGVFVSFMSGNSTRLAVSLAEGRWQAAGAVAGVLALFVLGAMLGALVAGGEGARSRSRVLAVEALLLGGAAVAAGAGIAPVAIGLMVMAMAVENSIFLRDGEVGVSLTYMTGTLVKTGHALAAAVRGGDLWAFRPYMALWAGLVGGALLGAVVYGRLGLDALWPAAAVAMTLALGVRFSRAA